MLADLLGLRPDFVEERVKDGWARGLFVQSDLDELGQGSSGRDHCFFENEVLGCCEVLQERRICHQESL